MMIADRDIKCLKKPDFWGKKWRPEFRPDEQNSRKIVFLEIAYNDSLQHCITSSRGKAHKKSFCGPNLGRSKPKSGPKLDVLPFSEVWFISFL